MRMQRCSISAVRGYSAWSMKLRCRFSAMIRCASGSIQVVTKVARLRSGMPSRTSSSPISRIASSGSMPSVGELVVRGVLEQEVVAELPPEVFVSAFHALPLFELPAAGRGLPVAAGAAYARITGTTPPDRGDGGSSAPYPMNVTSAG